ncbi:peptidylprolyl isomerase [Campylobacter concisus]|uniref:peptidylprolyl isomerase n=1 Tax=Campylobacter concisus TaxID=199 RepID=UPI00122C8D41|nr:peptidylprolyl isomerase [Campylobacter concisus]
MKKFLFPAVLSLAAAVTLNAAVVATVDGDAINDSDISALLSAAMPGFDASKLQPNEKKRIIDDLINRKLLLKDAKATGIEKDVDYIKAVKAAQEGIAVELYMRKLFDGIKVSDSDLRDFYNKNKASMNQPAQARARHILVEDEKTANDVIAQLKNLKGEALTKKFAELASQKSIDKGSAAHGGELGWFGQSQMVKPFADAAFSMANGTVSTKPVKTQFGYHVILKEDGKAAGTVSFEQAKPEIEQAVKMEKFQAAVRQKSEALRQKAKIEYK